MGKMFYLMGKSASGKDTIYERLIANKALNLQKITLYTTRPMREGEIDGVTYHFVSEPEFISYVTSDKLIEHRSYNTAHGIWRYFTVQDKNLDLDNNNYLVSGVLESYKSTCSFFGKDRVFPLYINVEDGERLERAIKRERLPENGKYEEMCRRFLADQEDFSDEAIAEAEIPKFYENDDLEICLKEIEADILTNI